jgi:hypothetical protein
MSLGGDSALEAYLPRRQLRIHRGIEGQVAIHPHVVEVVTPPGTAPHELCGAKPRIARGKTLNKTLRAVAAAAAAG